MKTKDAVSIVWLGVKVGAIVWLLIWSFSLVSNVLAEGEKETYTSYSEPFQDAWVDEATPDVVKTANPMLILGEVGVRSEVYLQYLIPENDSNMISANLTIWATLLNVEETNLTYSLVTYPWDEDVITWNSKPGASTFAGTFNITTDVNPSNVTIDVMPILDNYCFPNEINNFTLMINLTYEGPPALVTFNSKEFESGADAIFICSWEINATDEVVDDVIGDLVSWLWAGGWAVILLSSLALVGTYVYLRKQGG